MPSMRRRPGTLSEPDSAAWAAYAQAVRPLPGRTRLPLAAAPPPPPALPVPDVAIPKATSARRALPNLTTGVQPPGLDSASWHRFHGGRVTPTRTLDLHGKTVHAAHQALLRFLLAAHADQVRCVEIITGRGSGEAGGAIRRELPHWIGSPALRPLILAAAHPHARNLGATRLLLRRRR